MKIKWSAFFSLALLLSLVGCGAEQFGSVPQSTSSDPDPIKVNEEFSCTSHTLIKPKVDILYVFDNTPSYHFAQESIKQAVFNSVGQISSDFDSRIIFTRLIDPENPMGTGISTYSDYRVINNSQDNLPSSVPSSNKIHSIQNELGDLLSPYMNPQKESGLTRVYNFMNHHKGGLFRRNAYHFVILISNSFDEKVEEVLTPGANPTLIPGAWATMTENFDTLRSSEVSQLNSKKFRLFALTAHSHCKEGWRPSIHSYKAMANYLYGASGSSDNSFKDSYNLCNQSEISNIFSSVNQSIQQVIVQHVYEKWPIKRADQYKALTDPTQPIDVQTLQVFKSSSNSSPVRIPETDYDSIDLGSVENINILKNPGLNEMVSGRHFIQFKPGKEPRYPECIQVTSTSKKERFGYIVLPRKPVESSIHVVIRGNSTSDWIYTEANLTNPINIKIPIPGKAGSELPPAMRNGYMIKLINGQYYESGESVQVNYLPASIN